MARRKRSHKVSKKKAPKSRRHAHSKRRRSLRGLGALGEMTSSKSLHGAIPAVVAALVTAGVTIGVRVALAKDIADPTSTKAKAVKYAPAIGAGAGLVAAGAFLGISGASAATSAALVSIASAAGLMATDKLLLDKPEVLAAIAAGSAPSSPAGTSGLYGLGAIVPETNLGAILMERNRGGLIGMGATVPHAGEIVDLRGTINPAAFGQ